MEMTSIRGAESDDVAGMVRAHLASFPNFFLTFMGPRFLKLLYHEIRREPGSVSLVATSSDNTVLGFAVGVTDQVGLYRRLATKRWFAFGLASSGVALLHPSVIPKLFRAFKYPNKVTGAACPALLMSIAVAPEAKGGGVGRALLDRFLAEMRKNGAERVCLTTDRDDNVHANTFYTKAGFLLVREFETPEGRWMNEYVTSTKR